MSMTHFPRRGRFWLAVSLTATALLVAAGSAALATDSGTTGSTDPDVLLTEPLSETATTADLRARLDDLSIRFDEIQADNTTLREAVEDLSTERDALVRSLENVGDLSGPLEADRQLLFELRKELPETRPEAEAHIERLRSLALSSDPARLGQLVDRVGEAAPDFLDWRFSDFASDSEAAQAYLVSGAGAFDTTLGEFRNEVLMTVANRLDGLLTVIDRLR